MVVYFCSERNIGDGMDWKIHKSTDAGSVTGATSQCSVEIHHFSAYTLISTRNGQQLLADDFVALVYISKHEGDTRKIEVCCAHRTAIEVLFSVS